MDALLAEMSARLFTEWMTYFSIEPFGAPLNDAHLATMEALFYNANRGKSSAPKEANDFQLHKNSPKQSGRDWFAGFKNALRMGGQLME